MTRDDPLVLAVVRFPDGWRILAHDRRWGRFPYRVDAEEAALRLARKSLAAGRPVQLLVQDAHGELRKLEVA